MLYSRLATANKAPGLPLVYTETGIFKSALVAENAEVSTAARGGGGGGGVFDDDDDDDDDDGNNEPSDGGIMLVPRAERGRKRKATDGPV